MQDLVGPQTAIDRFVAAIARLYRSIPVVQRPSAGALHHIRYDQPVFDIQITDEFFVLDMAPDEVLAAVGAADVGARHCLTVFHRPAEAASPAYADRGYRYAEQLFLMARALRPPATAPAAIAAQRVTTAAEAAWINVGRDKIVVTPEHLRDPAIAHYYLAEADVLAATGILVLADPQVAYVADVFTFPAYRGRGIATALMRHMLADAAAAGATHSLLLATADARRLYAKLGYGDLLLAQVFVAAPHPDRTEPRDGGAHND